MLTNRIPLNVSPGGVPPVVRVSQYDAGSRVLAFQLVAPEGELVLPAGLRAEIHGTKPDGNGFSYDCTIQETLVTAQLTAQMTAVAGNVVCEVVLFVGTPPTSDSPASSDYQQLATANFILAVERAALDKDTLVSGSEIKQLVLIMDHKDEIIAAANKTDENVATVGELTERAEAAAEGAEESEQSAAETLDTVNEKAAQVLAVTTEADRIAARALAIAGTASAAAGAASAQLDEVMNRLAEVNMALDEKVDGAYEEGGYLYLTSQGAITVGPLGPFAGGGGGGGGGSTNNAVLTAANTTGWLSKTMTLGTDCVLSVTWSSLEDEIPTGNGSVSVLVNNIEKRTVEIPQGSWSVNVSDFLTPGQNKVRIVITDVYGNVRALNFSVKAVELKITTLFDRSVTYKAGTDIAFTYVPSGAVEKTVYFQVDGVTVGTQTVTNSGRQQTFTVPGMAHGSHRFVCFFTAEIDGETVQSEALDFDLIVVDEQSTAPIIASDFRAYAARQYQTLNIPYRVFTPNALASQVTLWAGETQIAALSVGRTEQVWSYRLYESGPVTFTINSGVASLSFSIDVAEADIDVAAETDSLALYLSSAGRSNSEHEPGVWKDADRNITCALSGFNFVSNGWVADEEGITVLRVSGDVRVTIPYKPFARDFRGTGKTIEIEFATRDVLDYDADIVSCMSGGRGFRLTSQRAVLKSEQREISTHFKENEHVRVSFVAEKRSENRLLYVYINGIMSGAVQYPADDDFSQQTPVDISIGSSSCATDIYCIRVYDNNLTRYQVLDNWIADSQNIETLIARYEHNDVYDEYGKIVIEKLPKDLPYMIIEAAELPQYKGDKKTVSISYTDPVTPSRSFMATGVQINVQGTSSAPYARKNYDTQYKKGFTTPAGTVVSNYELATGVIPFNRFVLKADVASSEGANNVELVKLFCDACPYKRPEELADPKVRKGIFGFPIIVFWRDTADDSLTMLGKYNFNLPKRAPEPYGYSGDMESWEFQNNTSDLMNFLTDFFDETMQADPTTGESKEKWRYDYEARFPEDTWTDYSKLQELHTFIISTYRTQATGEPLSAPYTDADGNIHTVDNAAYRLAKFRTEFGNYAEVDSFIFYYIFTELFLMVDSRAKNLFIGFSGSDTDPEICHAIDRKAVAEPYDMDTAIGTNNEGSLVFGYSYEDTDHLDGGADVFNGQNSVLWNNLRDAFQTEIVQMYQRLRSEGILSYASVEKRFEDHQAKWSEAIFNDDAQFKYLDPLVNPDPGKEPTDVYLPMLQGSKAEQRKWWLYNRFRYMDSKWNAGDALSDVIQLRGYAKTDITITPYADIYPTVKYGSYLVSTRGRHGVPSTLVCPLDNVNDTEIYIYSASQLASVGDLSGLKVGFADFSKATKIQSIKVGDGASGYTNGNLTGLSVGTNPLLGSVDARNCTSLTGTVDLSGASNIEHVYLEGTGVTGVSLPNGGILKTLHLPDSVTNLTLRNQPGITDFVMADYSGITTLRVENCPTIPVMDILADIPANSRVRILGFSMNVETTEEVEDFYDYLDTMRGLDESGGNLDKPVVSGVITGLDAITGAWLAEMTARYPNIEIGYQHISSQLKYYNYDGTELLNTETILDGGNGTYSGTPSRTSTDQYSYAFVGWNRNKNATAADANATKAVIADRNVYAVFSATVRTYTVRFYNGSTLLQTVNDVPYGGNATYTGEPPESEEEGFVFNGWNPTGKNIHGTTNCKAVFRDTRSPFVQYLEGTLTEYVNDTAESVCDYAFYGRNNLTSVETSAEEIGISAFCDCTKLTTVNLIGSGAVSVGPGAFANCVKLDAVIIRADSVGTMATGTGVFSQTKIRNGYGAIYVEDSLVSSYKAAANWGAYNICPISAYPVTDFSTISDTWAQIFAAELDGTYSTKYVVGDTKKFILGDSEEVYMQIAAMDVDVLADNNGTAKITWISKSLLKDGHRMNPARVAKTSGTGTLGGWEACEMRTYLRETVFPNIPQEIRSAIKTVKKYSCIYTTDGVKQVDVLSEDSVWIPSYREMCGGTDYESSTPVYSSTASARIRSKIGGSNSYWWLRSANSAYNFSYVDESGGTKATYTPTNSLGVVLGFCT